jgi:hypothetical protein
MLQGNWQMGIIDTERGLRQMDEARKKTTKELQEESKALLEEGKRLQAESEKASEHLILMANGERIEYNRRKPDGATLDMTIYYDKLTGDQKQELECIEKAVFEMAYEVTERGGRRKLKDGGQ